MLIALSAGLAVGLIHVLSGPDHLGAIAPIVSVERQRPWVIGLRWGLGHTLGFVLIALLAAAIAHVTLVDMVSASSERLVGVLLLAIAAWGFYRLRRPQPHHHPDASEEPSLHPHRRRLAPYAIGVLHGCAGGSHMVALVLALAFPTVAGVMTYLVGFVAGTLLAMTAFAAGLGWLVARKGTSPRFHQGLLLTSSCFSAAVGCWWLLV
jgi:hypothetical protein